MFKNVLGNENVKRILEKSINESNISHSYMFIGKKGIGKLIFAKEFAKALYCIGEEKPCGKCEECNRFEEHNNPDIVIIDEEEKSIKTETIKEMVKSVYEKPIQSTRKIYIINDSEKMTKEAQNSLLKTLEEPPQYVIIILITENENLLLNTVKSRCTKIKFNELTDGEIKQILKSKYSLEEVADTVLEFAEGSAERALIIHGKDEIFNTLKNIVYNLDEIDIIDFLNKKDIVFKEKEDIYEILNYINIMLYKKSKENVKYINCIKIIEETKDRLKKNCNYDMTIDNLLLKLREEING